MSTAKKEWVARLTADAEREIQRVHDALHCEITNPRLVGSFEAFDDTVPRLLNTTLAHQPGWRLTATKGWIQFEAHGKTLRAIVHRGVKTVYADVAGYVIRGRREDDERDAGGLIEIVTGDGVLRKITLYSGCWGSDPAMWQKKVLVLKP